ncbi:MAG TPA: hypothetical protein VLT33_33685 [Labilithrix sp.]|nr:hypothetical protein [Labilithrix sp.]
MVAGTANAGVAANGGGGGSSYDNTPNGTISMTPAAGGPANACFGAGGPGGAGASPGGGTGFAGATACPGYTQKFGGGGGGAAGFVRILTASGDVTADPSFVISPSLAPGLQKGKIATR